MPQNIKKKTFLYNKEVEFYKKHLKQSEFNYLISNTNEKEDKFSSYYAIFQSKVAVGCQSTLLRDKIGLSQKILSCNLTDFENYNFPIEGICAINNCSYEEFSSRLNKILNIRLENYFEKINPSFVMMFDKNKSVIDKIKSKINESLN